MVAGWAFFVGPGCFVCPWAAARPRAVRAASCARRVVSKPGQAPPPPTGTAARPSGPSGALHTSGAGSLFGSSTRRLEARPGPYWDPVPRPQPSRPALTSHISEPTRNFARNSPTSLSNSEIRSLELQRFPTLLKLLLIELRATFPVTSPRHSPVPPTKPHKREKIRPARLHQCPRAKKFAQHRQNCPKSALFRLQGELFRGMAQNPLLLGEFFRADGCRSHLTPPADRLA